MTTSADTAGHSPSSTHPDAERYRALAGGFTDVVDAVDADSWSADSPCDGWSARDVVGHVIDTQRDFFARHDIDLGPRPVLDEPALAWRTHAARTYAALTEPGVADIEFESHVGDTTTVGATIVRFYGFDMIAHRWDVATAAGRDLRFTDDELDTLERSAAGFGDALYSDGVCSARLDVADDADRQTRLLAVLGRVG